MKRLIDYLTLPREVSAFERTYLLRLDRVARIFFALHIPAMMAVALLAGTNLLQAGLFTTVVAVGPWIARRAFENPRHVAKVHAIAAMCMGGLLVHFGQGVMQIEMHFYFFVLLALLAVFGDPMVILIGAATIVAHHLLLFFLLPQSVFNYDASFWAIVVHAAFVVLESVGACFVARSFFDNVFGLEQRVARRTRALTLILDNIGQGFLTFGADGVVGRVRSAILETWLGPYTRGTTIWDYLGQHDPKAAAHFMLAWEAVMEDVLPRELTLAQMPTRLTVAGRPFELSYRPVGDDGAAAPMLLILSDVTFRVASEERAQDLGEISVLLENFTRDRAGFAGFLSETRVLLGRALEPSTPAAERRRAIHTVKGNCGFHGLASITALCHELETRFAEDDTTGAKEEGARLQKRWDTLTAPFVALGETLPGQIAVTARDYLELIERVRTQRTSGAELVTALVNLPTEPTEVPLGRLADQARALASRLDKGELEVSVESNGLRLGGDEWKSFWSAMTHVVRNAVDHGLELPEVRAAEGKSAIGQLRLSTKLENDELVCVVDDDGAGIDWDEVRARAAARGLPHTTSADLEAAIFVDGLSTKETQTEISGRGVGMSAVRASCEQLGGHVRVTSARGKGTRIELRLPKARMNALVADAR